MSEIEISDSKLGNKHEMRTARSGHLLLEAACEIVANEGMNALTLANVGERAGYSRGLVTARFGSKDGLIQAMVERLTAGWSESHVGPRIKDLSGLDSVLEHLREMRDQTAKLPSRVLALQVLLFDALNPASPARPPCTEYDLSLTNAFERGVRAGIVDGTIRADADPRREAAWLLEGIRGIGFHWLLTPDSYDAVAALDHLIGVVEGWLGVATPDLGDGLAR